MLLAIKKIAITNDMKLDEQKYYFSSVSYLSDTYNTNKEKRKQHSPLSSMNLYNCWRKFSLSSGNGSISS